MIDIPILAFDTSGPHIAAVLSDGDVPVGEIFEDMPRGQAEALLPRLEGLLAAQDLGWTDLAAIGVGIGPGNFTGIRISVSAARGLGLALDIPIIGLSTFALRRDPDGSGHAANELVTLAAPRGQIYGQMFRDGMSVGEPLIFDPATPPYDLQKVNLLITGERASDIARVLGGQANETPMTDLPRRMARLTARLYRTGGDHPPPKPLYVRPADAAPPKNTAPVILP